MSNPNKTKLISVCIPAYEMRGLGPTFLEETFKMLEKQTFKDFDVVISDESKSSVIKNVCDKYAAKLDIKYFKNPDGLNKFSTNTNYSMKMATGKLLKVLLLDDFLYSPTALEEIVQNFDLEKDGWMATACIHSTDGEKFFRPFYPRYDDKTILFKNTISSPSVLVLRNSNPLMFDTNMMWYVDVDYYKRCFQSFGEPKILNKIGVVNRVGAHQATNITANEDVRQKEYFYILDKYKIKNSKFLRVLYVANRYKRATKGLIKKMLGR